MPNGRIDWRHVWWEGNKARWVLLYVVLTLLARHQGWLHPDSPITVVLTRPLGAALGAILAHVIVQTFFPYIDLFLLWKQALHAKRQSDRLVAGVMFAGVCLLRGGLYAGAMVAVAMAVGV